MTAATAAVAAFVVTLVIAPLALRGLRRLQLLDTPNARSSHDLPTPRGGGVAVMVGVIATVVILDVSELAKVAILAAAFGVLGLIDDFRRTPPLVRLIVQLSIAGLAAPLLLQPLHLGTPVQVGLVAVAALWIVAFVNGFNFMDGINGISAAQGILSGVTWWVVGRHLDLEPIAVSGAAIAGATAAFAPFNAPRARMFLGDVGSYFIGAWLASTVVLGLHLGAPPEAMVFPLALYLADTATTIVRRVLRRERLQEAHRDHTYQRLVQAGWSHSATTGTVAATVAITSVCGAVSLLASPALRVAADATALAAILGYLSLPHVVTRTRPDAEPTTSAGSHPVV